MIWNKSCRKENGFYLNSNYLHLRNTIPKQERPWHLREARASARKQPVRGVNENKPRKARIAQSWKRPLRLSRPPACQGRIASAGSAVEDRWRAEPNTRSRFLRDAVEGVLCFSSHLRGRL